MTDEHKSLREEVGRLRARFDDADPDDRRSTGVIRLTADQLDRLNTLLKIEPHIAALVEADKRRAWLISLIRTGSAWIAGVVAAYFVVIEALKRLGSWMIAK